MPCSDSSSSIALQADHDERFISFEFAKITCGREITADTGFNRFCCGQPLIDIINTQFTDLVQTLDLKEEEEQFILYMEWDTLRCAIAKYLGVESEEFDSERCQVTSIEHTERGVEVALIILPPKELPKILPCNLAQDN